MLYSSVNMAVGRKPECAATGLLLGGGSHSAARFAGTERRRDQFPLGQFGRMGLALAWVLATLGTTACISKDSKAPQAALVRLEAPAVCNLEKLASTVEPPAQSTVVVRGAQLLTALGWAVDAEAKTAASGVNLVLDGKAYPATYSIAREDVAGHFGVPAYRNSGFDATIPLASVGKGRHTVVVQVVAANGKGYYEGKPVFVDIQ